MGTIEKQVNRGSGTLFFNTDQLFVHWGLAINIDMVKLYVCYYRTSWHKTTWYDIYTVNEKYEENYEYNDFLVMDCVLLSKNIFIIESLYISL